MLLARLHKFAAKGQSLSPSTSEASSRRPRGYPGGNAKIKNDSNSVAQVLATTYPPHPASVEGVTEAWSPVRARCSRVLGEGFQAVVFAKFPKPCASQDGAAGPSLRSGRGAARG